MSVRAKVRVESIEPFGEGGASVTMRPVYNDAPENQTWSKYTPSGHFQMSITNPPAAEFFNVGDELYVDFTPVTAA